MSENQKNQRPILKLPLIGKLGKIECFAALQNIIEIPEIDNQFGKKNIIENFQRALGDFLCDSDLDNILKVLFPSKEEIIVEVNINSDFSKPSDINDNSLILPLFSWSLIERGKKDSEKSIDSKFSSAWSSLMLELGEFYLDERFNELESEIKENLLQYLCFKSGSLEHNVLYALFDSHEKIVTEIWDRILGNDIFLIFIDDDENFANRWGLYNSDIPEAFFPQNGITYFRREDGNMAWLNPRPTNPNNVKEKLPYKQNETLGNIIEMIRGYREKNPKVLPVLVVDLLIKDKRDINRIKGDNLITELRKEFMNDVLIIGFTGGKSPFVINSAVKAGADIVIMKERGETVEITNSHGTGNPGGLFDLLWALSRSISRWRFLEKYKELVDKKLEKDRHFYRPVLDKLFITIENESPFWKEYLSNWQRKMEDLRLASIFKNYSHE